MKKKKKTKQQPERSVRFFFDSLVVDVSKL